MSETVIIVIAGIIRNKEGKILLARRAQGRFSGLWEFPGGKLQPNESEPDCLKREIWEELGLEITVGDFFTRNDHTYPFVKISLIVWKALCQDEKNIRLRDHDSIIWIDIHELENFSLTDADIPVARKLIDSQ